MYVVGHHGPRKEVVAIAVEELERVAYGLSDVWIRKRARSLCGMQRGFNECFCQRFQLSAKWQKFASRIARTGGFHHDRHTIKQDFTLAPVFLEN